MSRVDAPQTGLHRGLAVRRDPGGTQSAVGTRVKAQGALAVFFEDKIVIDEAPLAPSPFSGLVLVDAGTDGVDRRELAPALLLYGNKNLPTIRVKPVPRVAHDLVLPSGGCAARGRGGR